MSIGQGNLGKIDSSGRYHPQPRQRAQDFGVSRASVFSSGDSPSGIGISMSRITVNWQALGVVELPLLALLLLVFAISVLVSPDFVMRASGAELPLLYVCPFFALTGIPCLFCGMTRSFMAMGNLELSQSFTFHPLGPALFVLLAGLAAALMVSVVTRQRIRLLISPALRRNLIAGGSFLLLAAWLLKVVIWRETGLI